MTGSARPAPAAAGARGSGAGEVEHAVADQFDWRRRDGRRRAGAEVGLGRSAGERQARWPARRRCRAVRPAARLSKQSRAGVVGALVGGQFRAEARTGNTRRRPGRSRCGEATQGRLRARRLGEAGVGQVQRLGRCRARATRSRRSSDRAVRGARRRAHAVHQIERASPGRPRRRCRCPSASGPTSAAPPAGSRWRAGHGEMRIFVYPGPDDALDRRRRGWRPCRGGALW